MGKHDFRPQRVLKLANQLLETKRISSKPPWYDALQNVPPQQILMRPAHTKPVSYEDEERLLQPGNRINPWKGNLYGRAPQTWAQLKTSHVESRGSTFNKGLKTKRAGMYKPQAVEYPEDDLRSDFFGDHPWELARPRVVTEKGGEPFKELDWSKMDQPNQRKLDGESVIQRQMHLMRDQNLSKSEAYDVARREFYALRHAEEVERRIAKEEAQSYGAYFGKSWLEIGEELEDAQWERWKEQATVFLREKKLSQAQGLDIMASESDDTEPSPTSNLEDPSTQSESALSTQGNDPATTAAPKALGGAPIYPGPASV